jgi:hypothetical protein
VPAPPTRHSASWQVHQQGARQSGCVVVLLIEAEDEAAEQKRIEQLRVEAVRAAMAAKVGDHQRDYRVRRKSEAAQSPARVRVPGQRIDKPHPRRRALIKAAKAAHPPKRRGREAR